MNNGNTNIRPRKKGWDYSRSGQYFITIVTHRRNCILGTVTDQKVILSEIGEIVEEEWVRSFQMRSELSCDVWVIMPNHIHAILILKREKGKSNKETSAEIPKTGIAYRPPRSVPSFVAGFKSAVTRRIRQLHGRQNIKVWQERYHDHIIRDPNAYEKIKQYIGNNPVMWEDDMFHCK